MLDPEYKMPNKTTLLTLLLMLFLAQTASALDGLPPEAIAERMATKFARGVANVATSVVEIPKQSYLTVRDRGAIGYGIGPLKGMGMAFYRLFAGVAETVFFAVPQPGYYDPMISPEFVWDGWGEKRVEPRKQSPAEPAERKEE